MLTIKELENSNTIYIDPTDRQPKVHPQFFEITAEEHQEQERIKLREMSLFEPIDATRAREIIAEQNRIKDKAEKTFWETAGDTVIASIDSYIDKLPNAHRLTNEQRNHLQSLIFLTGTQTFHHEVETHDPVIAEINKRAKRFNNFEFGSAKDLITSLVLAGCGKVATAKQLKDYEWNEQKGYWTPINKSKEITPKKNRADYKRKFYKNTAKQAKPSPMLMSLVGKTK